MWAFAWDTESLLHKPEDMTWDVYKEESGISIACAIPLFKEGLRLYGTRDDEPNDIETLRKDLLAAPFTVSFNGHGWDRVLVANTTGRPCPPTNEIDLWKVIRDATSKEKWEKGTWKLDSICKRTFRNGKTLADGAGAPSLLSQGKIATLVEYCIHDVMLTKALFHQMASKGYVVGPYNRVIDVSGVMNRELDRVGAAKALSY